MAELRLTNGVNEGERAEVERCTLRKLRTLTTEAAQVAEMAAGLQNKISGIPERYQLIRCAENRNRNDWPRVACTMLMEVQRWFGRVDNTGAGQVRDNLRKLRDYLSEGQRGEINVITRTDAEWPEGRIAETPASPIEMWQFVGPTPTGSFGWLLRPNVELKVGPLFWEQTQEEQWEVLVHELTHAVFGSNDEMIRIRPLIATVLEDAAPDLVNGEAYPVYGRRLVELLAETRPRSAIRNADNYGYFVTDGVTHVRALLNTLGLDHGAEHWMTGENSETVRVAEVRQHIEAYLANQRPILPTH